MFFKKTAGNIRKHSKLITSVILAMCIVLASFVSIPLATFADNTDDVVNEDIQTTTAIFIGKTNSDIVANTFIPVDIPNGEGDANLFTGEVVFKLTFDCKMLSGSKPIVGVMRVNTNAATTDRSVFTEPSWCNNATDVTVEDGVCTAYFKVDFSNRFNADSLGWRSFYITVGNAEHDGVGISEKDYSASFIMSNAKLFACDTNNGEVEKTNRLPLFDEANIDFGGTYYVRSNGCKEWDCPGGATAMKWHIDASSYLVKAITVPVGFNTSSDYDAENFVLNAATETTREYYTNDKYEGVYFEKLANSSDKAFGVISSDLNKKFVFIDANHQGEEDSLTVDGYKPTKNKVANLFLPLSIGQYTLTGGKPATNKKVLLKVTFKASRLEGDAPPVLGRVVGKVSNASGTSSWAWGLSTINARGSAYYTSYDRSDNGGGVRPQCTYNPSTGEFVGWVGVEIDNSAYNTCLGKSEVLTIGNAEHVYQVGTFDSTSFNSSFAISDIKVDLYDTDISGNKITPKSIIAEDIAPALVADNIDADGKWYFDYKDNTKSSDHENDLIRASQNKWHIDGEHSLVLFDNVEDISAYAPKQSVHISGAKGILSAFTSVEANKTYGFVFKNKYESGAKVKPFVEFTTASGTQKLDTSAYLSDTGDYYDTAITFKTPANLVDGKNIRLGLDVVSATTDATFGGFELFEVGEDGMMITTNNLLKKIYIKEGAVFKPYSADEEIGVWMKEGTIGDTSTTLDILYCEDNYYLLNGKPNMVMFQGKEKKLNDDDLTQVEGDPGEFSQSLRIESNKRYRFTANLKFAGTGYEGDKYGLKITYRDKNALNKTLLDYTDPSDSSKYLIEYEFDSPTSLKKSGANFKIALHVPNAFVSGYFANVSLVEIDANGDEISGNLVQSGSFIDGDYTGWTRNDGFFMFKFSNIPENFFSTNPTNKIHAIQYRDTENYNILQQQYLLFKPSMRYELSYTTLLTGKAAYEPYGVVYTRVLDKDKTDSSWGSGLSDNERNPDRPDTDIITTKVTLNEKALRAVQGDDYDSSEAVDHAIRITKIFTVDDADTLPIYQSYNASIRFYFMTGSSGYISDYALYEIDENGKRLSNNLMLDADFSAGFQTLDTYAGINKTPWNYSGVGVTRNIELENGFFENYCVPKKIIRSDGDAENVTYGNQLYVDPGSRYYFSGKYVKTNFVGVAPEVLYRSKAANGEYVAIPFEEYYDSGRYYFETDGGFTIPDDAVLDKNGKADIIVRMNNLNYGKGYFCGLTLTQDDSSVNLFNESKAQLNGFKSLNYDPEILAPFEGDDKFEDGNWSGENAEPITTGAIVGVVLNKSGMSASGVRMRLMPGKITTITGSDGVYNFDNLTPGDYTLYLVESSGNTLLCCTVTVQASILLTLPDIYYDDNPDDGNVDIDPSEPIATSYGVIRGYCYDSSGNLLSGVDIYANNKSHHTKTNEKGMFEFDRVPPGEYKICTILDDGSAYVFKTVKVEAGKGILVKVMMPDKESDGLPIWAIITIIGGGVVLAAGIAVTILILLKKKKKKQVTPTAE